MNYAIVCAGVVGTVFAIPEGMSRSRVARPVSGGAILFTIALIGARGEEGDSGVTIVTAARHAQDPVLAPYLVDVIARDDLRGAGGARSMPDALRYVPGVNVQKTSYGQGSPYLRGVTGYHTLFLVDGIRLNNATFRSGPNQYWTTVDPLSVDRLEVVKGPGGVLHGSDAVGGTVNAITRSPEGGDGVHGTTLARLASAEDSETVRQEFSAVRARFGVLGGVSYKEYDDYDAGRRTGIVNNSGYRERDADLKAVWTPTPAQEVTVAYQRVAQVDAPRTHTTTRSRSFEGTDVGTDVQRELDQTRELLYARWDVDGMPGALADRATLTAFFHDQVEDQKRIRSNLRTEWRGYDDAVLGLSAQFEREQTWGRWVYGAELDHDDVDSYGVDYNADGSIRAHLIQGQVADEAAYDRFGAYAQAEIGGDDARGSLVPGIRYTQARARASDVDVGGVRTRMTDRWEHVAGSLRGRWALPRGFHLFGGASQGFRAPNLSDLTRLDVARSGEVEIASPGLEPEEFLSYEAGVKREGERWGGQAAYYYTDIRNFIDRVPTGQVNPLGSREVRKENTGDGRIEGVEVGGRARIDDVWTAWGSAAWQIGDVETFTTSDAASKDRRPMSQIPPAALTLALRWTDPATSGFWVEGTAMFVGEQDRLSPGDRLNLERIPPGGTPGYRVYGVRGEREVARWCTVSVAVENLTNEDYRAHGSGTNGVGTNFVLGMEARY